MILIVEPAAIGGRVVPRQFDRGAVGARVHVRPGVVVRAEPPVLLQGDFAIGDGEHAIDRFAGIGAPRVDDDHGVPLVDEPSPPGDRARGGQGTVDLLDGSGLAEGEEESPRRAVDARVGLVAVHVDQARDEPLAHRLGNPRCQVAEGQQQSPPGRRVGLSAESGHQRAGLGVAFGQGMDRLGLHAGIAGGAQQAPGGLRSPEAEQGGRAAARRRAAMSRGPGRESSVLASSGAAAAAARSRTIAGSRFDASASRGSSSANCRGSASPTRSASHSGSAAAYSMKYARRGNGGRPCRPRNGPGRSAAGSARRGRAEEIDPSRAEEPVLGQQRVDDPARSPSIAAPPGRARPARRPPEGDAPAPTPDRSPPARAGPGHPDGGSPVPRR